MVSIRTGLARMTVITPMGEPNTPLAFRRRDACQLKQQAGHGKIVVGSGQAQKILSLELPTMLRFYAHSFRRKPISALTKL